MLPSFTYVYSPYYNVLRINNVYCFLTFLLRTYRDFHTSTFLLGRGHDWPLGGNLFYCLFPILLASALFGWENNLIWKVTGILPEEAGFGRWLWRGCIPLATMMGSDVEWTMVVCAEPWLSAEEGTSRSRVWALMEGAAQRAGWRDRMASVSSGESAWHRYRPVERLPASGSGKVPIPLSSVLIWQFDSRHRNIVRIRDGSHRKIKGSWIFGSDLEGRGHLEGRNTIRDVVNFQGVAWNRYLIEHENIPFT